MGSPLLQSAVTEWDGRSVNAGYVALVVVLATVVVLLGFICALAAVAVYNAPTHATDLGEFAKAVGITLGSFAAFLPALGAFVWADRKNDPRP